MNMDLGMVLSHTGLDKGLDVGMDIASSTD